MWIPVNQIRNIESMRQSAVELEPLLTRAIAEKVELVNDHCPRCGNPLKVKFLNPLVLFVKTCPDGHVAWITPMIAQRIHTFLTSSVGISAKTPDVPIDHKRKIVLIMAGFILMMAIQAFMQYTLKSTTVVGQSKPFQVMQSWGPRDYSKWYALPSFVEGMNEQEFAYWQQWRKIMEEGITNRMNAQDALNATHYSEEYMAIYEEYRRRQDIMINKLADLQPPERLRPFQDYVVNAGYDQLRFYEDYARAKTENKNRRFDEFRNHADLVAGDQKLWAAYHNFEALYPERTKETNDAIEQRLAWFDII